MKSIYITGANGLLGSNLVQYLSKYRLRLSVRSSKNIFNNFNYDIIPDEKINDLNKSEFLILLIITIPTLFFGFYPEPLLNTIQISVNNLIDTYNYNLVSFGVNNG